MSRIEQALLALTTMPATALDQEWVRVHGTPAPRISPDLLRLGIAYRLQEKALGGLQRSTTKALANMAAQKRMARMLKPGTRLVRSWNGCTINVLVEDDGYLFEDQRYRSLSAIVVAASRAKGMWMGGSVPLGYQVKDRKLIVDGNDAKTVRHIFNRYLALGTMPALGHELREQGILTKCRSLANGQTRGGIPFSPGGLLHLVKNRVYLGEVVHKGKAYPGEHPALIEPALWQAVQDQIATNSVARKSGRNLRDPSLLAGFMIDGLGRRMSPSHAVKGARRYRYYIKEPAWRISAHDIEAAIIARLKMLFEDRAAIRQMIQSIANDAQSLATALDLAREALARLTSSYHKRMMLAKLVTRVKLLGDEVEITIDQRAVLERLGYKMLESTPHPLVLTVSITRAASANRSGLSWPPGRTIVTRRSSRSSLKPRWQGRWSWNGPIRASRMSLPLRGNAANALPG